MPRDISRGMARGAVGSDYTFQCRLVARTASGTVVSEEGYAVTNADVSTATCSVYFSSSSTPSTAIATPTVTIGTSFFDLLNDNWWTVDTTGCTFRHNIVGSVFANPGHYVVAYTVTLTNGTVRKFAWDYYAETIDIVAGE